MPTNPPIKIDNNLAIRISWSMQTIIFVHKWRQRALGLPLEEYEEYWTEAAKVVLEAFDQLDDQVPHTLLDIYYTAQQLPVTGDLLLLGPLEVRVEDRRLELDYSGESIQTEMTYCFDIVRYRYEPIKCKLADATAPASTAKLA